MIDFSEVWLDLISHTLQYGEEVSPRGKLTREIPQRTITVNMRKPVLMIPTRSLSYCFMAAEAYWILSGDNKVSTIAPYNKHIANFSDVAVTCKKCKKDFPLGTKFCETCGKKIEKS